MIFAWCKQLYSQEFTNHEKTIIENGISPLWAKCCSIFGFQKIVKLFWNLPMASRKSIVYQFVNRVVILVYTLLVFTTTMERTFSHMKIIRTR